MSVVSEQKSPVSSDPERDRIVAEEESCLGKVLAHLSEHKKDRTPSARDVAEYDARLDRKSVV